MKRSLAAVCLSFSASLSTLGCMGEYQQEDYQPTIELPGYHTEIINGEKGDYKEFGSIIVIAAPNNYAFCTGTLIKPDLVITAAHCIYSFSLSYFSFIYGVNDLYDLYDNLGIERKGIVKSTHPSYLPKGEDHYDIALVLLDKEIEEAVPAKILPPSLYELELEIGREIVIAGYGENSDLNHPNGVLYYGNVSIISHDGLDMLLDGEDADACFGDSGGPSYLWSGRERYLTGVTSRLPPGKEQCGDGAMVELPGSYLDWIGEEYERMKDKAKARPVSMDEDAEIRGVREHDEEGCSVSGNKGKDWLPFLLLLLARKRKDKNDQ